ncbi:hypothetical protein ES703_18663 [subsurface metagenome]
MIKDKGGEFSTHGCFVNAGLFHVAAETVKLWSRTVGAGADAAEPLGTVVDNMGQVGQRLHIVYNSGATQIAFDSWKGRLDPGPTALTFQRLNEGHFLPADIGSAAPVNQDLKVILSAEDVLAQDIAGAAFFHGRFQQPGLLDKLPPDIDEGQVTADCPAGDDHPLKQLVRVMGDEHPVLEGSRLAFVSVADQVLGALVIPGNKTPFHTRRKTRAAATLKVRVLHHLDNLIAAHIQDCPAGCPVAFMCQIIVQRG